MSDGLVSIAREGHVAVLKLNDVARRNVLSDEMIDALIEALRAQDADADVRCMILTGAGTAFCSGGNAKDLKSKTGHAAGGVLELRRSLIDRFQRIPRAIYELETPLIAAVNGPAIGAGCDLAVMCDLRIASETARFVQAFVRLGVVSGDGGAWFLSRAIGPAAALEMMLSGDAVDAETARRIGLVRDVVAPDQLLAAAMSRAQRIARNPPHALYLTKRLVRDSARISLHESLELAATMQAVAMSTEDHKEAVAALAEGREGVFNGV